jgi:predicted nucleic acid-binding protein
VAVVVFDADVLIGFLGSEDPHHRTAVERMQQHVAAGTTRLVSTVNYTEILVGPLRRVGIEGAGRVDAMLAAFAIEKVPVDGRLARRAATVRAGSNLALPGSYAVATAIDAHAQSDDVLLESFDGEVLRAFARLARR